jgi:hypothetical protein
MNPLYTFNSLPPVEKKKYKQCSVCGSLKHISEFYHNKYSSDGRRGECIECHRDLKKYGESVEVL